MHPSIPLLVISLIYTILVSSMFFGKGKIKTVENKIYTWLLFTVMVGIIVDIMGIYCHLYLPDTSFIRWLVVKVYLAYLLLFIFFMTLYMISISYKDKMNFLLDNKKYKVSRVVKFLTFILVISLVLNFVLTFTYFKDGNAVYLSGSNTLFVYGISAIGILSWVILVLKNRKKISVMKVIPIIIFCIICIPVILLQLSNPEILVVTSLTAFLVNFMYHTIENPDKTMLGELYRNKELVEQTYEDKSNFLFEMTGEVRGPLFNISNLCNELIKLNNIDEIKSGLKNINNHINQLDFVVNDVLNVSNLDVQKIKFIDNRYNVNTIYNEIVNKITSCIGDNIEFRTSIAHNIPYLYGDHIKLKQIITSILLNSVKKTNKGFIEFHIDTIERYDVCRLIITIKDSGSGISIDKINEILESTGELNSEDINNMEKVELNIKLCQKIVKLMGGSLMIKSEIGKGTEVMLTINQRVNLDSKKNILEQYESFVNSNKKILVICQDKNINKIIKKKLEENNLKASYLLNGMDAIDKLKSGKKYDYIIIEDDMKEMSGYTTLQKMKELDKFNIPVIIMLKDNKLNIKEEYLKDGFKDYIIVNKLDEEIDRIIEKY